jgi:hypothetical protein
LRRLKLGRLLLMNRWMKRKSLFNTVLLVYTSD